METEPTSAPSNENLPPEGQAPSGPPQRRRVWIYGSAVVVLLLVAGIITLWQHKSSPSKNASTTTLATPAPQPTATPQAAANTNVWKGSVDATALPLGDGKVASAPQVGYVDSCTSRFRGGGARHTGSWVNSAAGTWNSEAKVAVAGSVDWPSASYSNTTSGNSRIITTDDLPQQDPTGTFPITRSDPAYPYDTNPNHIAAQAISLTLPLNPTAASSPGCVSLGYIGVLSNGVLLFDALDDAGRDAVAHETQDTCNGHPDGQERYHYHSVASCIRDRSTGASTLVGYAVDGYGIYVERDSHGNLPTNADLDACHGRTSLVEWNGQMTNMYHYDATLEYPYTVGCFHGTHA